MDFEQLGAFYLGRVCDSETGETRPETLLYDAKDLTTHAVCVGMTGSGKTGLCLGLLEEAALDGVPAIAIDPKGDLGNLLLSFPDLKASSFEPWVDPGTAARKGMTVPEFAAATAASWKRGLAEWGQDGKRIARMRAAADFEIYTPGSSAGRPLTVLRSFDAPAAAVVDDADAFRERITSAVSGLLALLGIEADPIRSREHVFLANVFDRAWRAGQRLDLAQLIREIQKPPFDRVGVLDLESFFPASDRADLAMRLNSLLASPGFAGWLDGDPLDVQRLLWSESGKPRISIVSIAHLSESERMFFVTILLNEVVAWMRSQAGTSSLRALLYMDEVFGYFPPTANPPSKRPMLTLLKQARAYGLGCVLATQNPVDLDYKGLSNTGTWFLGRLQTERDVRRVIEGLEGAASAAGAAFDKQRMTALLAGLDSRVFLMNNVHEDEPVLFKTRWAMSYLRGPLTRQQIKALSEGPKRAARAGAASAGTARAARSNTTQGRGKPTAAKGKGSSAASERGRPDLDPAIVELFAAPQRPVVNGAAVAYRPAVVGEADLHFVLASADVDQWRGAAVLADLSAKAGRNIWTSSRAIANATLETTPEALEPATYAPVPAAAARAKSYASWEKSLATHLYKSATLTIRKCRKLKLVSEIGEPEDQFAARVAQAAREKRDLTVEKLRARYSTKLARLKDQIERAEDKVERETEQYQQKKLDTAVSAGATVLGALFGRKLGSARNVGRASSTLRRANKIKKEKADVERAQERLDVLQVRLADLEEKFAADVEAAVAVGPDAYPITVKAIRPRKSDIEVRRVALVWVPVEA